MNELSDWIMRHEPVLRLSCFLGIFLSVAVFEAFLPRRKLLHSKLYRWANNLSIVVLSSLILRFAVPWLAVDAAHWAQGRELGLFNVITLPLWIKIVLTIVLLDLVVYAQHVLFHRVGFLWRLHRMHHADLDYDLTTALRFHPVEIVLSMLVKVAAVAAMGAPAAGVVAFEIILNGTALFNHGNLRLPLPLDKGLRWLLVTPDMHRVHHSVVRCETDSNYGFCLPWWDRMFATYRDQPGAGHEGMTIGLEYFRDPVELRIDKMLRQPFIA